MRKTLIISFLLLFVASLLVFVTDDAMTKDKGSTSLSKAAGRDLPLWNPNRIAVYLSNEGQTVSHIPTGSAGLEWPAGSHNTAHFAGGIWLAGMKNDEVVTAAGEFVTEFNAGNVVNGEAANTLDSRFKVYIINQKDVANPLGNDDYLNWPAADGAPVNPDGTPKLLGTSMAWAVFNDFDQATHNNLFQTSPMNVEVQMTVWAFDRPDAFGDMLFYKYKFINKGDADIDSTFVGLWNDIDIGDAQDLVGCDTTLGLGYMYKTQADGNYGDNPPAVGMDFFQGPIVPSPGDVANVSGRLVQDFKNLPMTSFAKYINGGPAQFSDPEIGAEAYNFMNGFDLLGDPVIDELTGKETKFWHPGDPVTGEGWLDPAHADKRFLMNAGPFVLAVGDTQEVVFGIMIAQGTTGTQSVALLKQADEIAQLAYDINFALPPSPLPPTVTWSAEPDAILLQWDAGQESYFAEDLVDIDTSGNATSYTFQGYNVYQADSPVITGETTVKKLAGFDLIDGIVDIRDDVFIGSLGQTVNMVVQEAQDTGLQRHLRITQDVVRGGIALIQNRKYYYAVTAYGYNPLGIPRTLESPLRMIAIQPQSAPIGSEATTPAGDTLAVTHTGPGDGSVIPIVVDPLALTGQTYQVGFRVDTTSGGVVWDVTAGGETKIAGLSNQGADGPGDYPIVDGMFLQVKGPPVAINFVNRSTGPDDVPPGPAGPRWISGVNWGGAFLFGGMDLGANFFGSTLGPTDYVTIDIRFTSDPTMSEATGWSRCYVYRRDLGYAVEASLGWAPMQSFDITDPANPRQLNICFVEDANAGLADLIWNPVDLGGIGGREYTFWMASDYDPDGGIYDDANWGPAADVLYALWPKSRGSHPYQEADFTLRITPNFVNSAKDIFEFTSVAAVRNNSALAKKQAAELVNVFPNPYTGFNVEETNPVDRFVTFTHLPETGATIQVFTLLGELVRTIEHDGASQFATWDMDNESDIPVASGMYIVRVDMPGVGVKILKMAVMKPEERLDIF